MTDAASRREHLKRDGALHPRPEGVASDLLERSPFFDADDLVQMKYEMLRSVSVDSRPVSEASGVFGLSRVAYYRAREQYREHGLAGLLPRKRGPKGPHKLTDAVMAFVRDRIAESETPPTWAELSDRIRERFGVRINPRSVERAVSGKKKGDR